MLHQWEHQYISGKLARIPDTFLHRDMKSFGIWNLLDVSFWTFWSVSYYALNWNTLHCSDISSNIQRILWNTILQLTCQQKAVYINIPPGSSIESLEDLEKQNHNSDTSSHREMKSNWYRVLEKCFRNTHYYYLTGPPFTVQAYHQNIQKIFKHNLWRNLRQE